MALHEVTIENIRSLLQEQKGEILSEMDTRFEKQGVRIETLQLNIDTKFEYLKNYIQQGFDALDWKIEYVYEQLGYRCDAIERRIDSVIESKVSKPEFGQLEKRVSVLEKKR